MTILDLQNGQQPANSPSRWQRFLVGRNPRRTFTRVLVLIVGCVVVFGFVLLPIRIRGASMHPTCRDGGINFVNRLAYVWRKPTRGDIVAIKTSGLHVMYLKRVVGLPGETNAIASGVVLINGQPLDEPYVKARAPWNVPPRTLAADEYFVIGDNRGMDQAAHSFGAVKATKIVGRILW